ncbi:MAG: ComEC/Rec2 family competence protein [bacterium]|nr:ComEC/Rec2 family competence protein [bacterium]
MTTLIRITLLYSLGILLGYYFTPLLPPLLITVFLIYFALIVIFALRYPRLFSGLSLGCFLLLGLIRYELFTTRTTDSLARFVSSREVDVIGTVNSEPDQRSNRTILKIKVKEIISNSAFIYSPQSTQLVNRESLIVERQQQVTNHEPRITNYEPQSAIRNPKSEIVNGTLYATVYNCPLNLQYGDLVKLRGALRFPPAGKQFNMRAYLARSGIYTVMKISDPTGEEVKKLGQGEINRFWQAVTAIRRQASGVIDQVLPSLEGSLLKALLLGQRETLPSALYYFFIDAGVVHVLAISGLHVGLIALMIFGLMRYYLLWRHRKLSALLTIPVVISYCFIAGARPSVVRASIMASAALGATVLDRENPLYNGLALSAFILLLINPCFLFDVGFQLSFIATLAIPLFTPIFDLILKPLITYRRLRLLFAVSLGVWVVLWPVLAFYFGRVNLIGILINPIVVPLGGIILGSGLAILAIAPLSLSLAKLVALPNLLALKALIYTVLLASGPDWANLSLNLSSWPVIFGYYLLLSGIILVHRRYRQKEKN